MTVSVKHTFVSGTGPDPDAALVDGDDWDAEHDLTMAPDMLLGRATPGAGPAEEIDCTAFGRTLIANADAAAARSDLELGTAATLAAGSAGGVATLDGGGKVPVAQLPAIALTETYVVASQAAMLALSAAETGDVAVRTDQNKSYILAGADPATLGDWQELLTPTGGVASFNGRTGSVTPQSGDYAQANITGLTTADSPQLTAINIGHASDSTLGRTSAGILNVEGVDLVNVSATQTLSGKTLTAPRFADLGFIADANGNELIVMDTVPSAVNEIKVANAATGNHPNIAAQGGDTNINLDLTAKGTGVVRAGGVEVVTLSGAQALTNKTLTGTKETVFTITDGAAFEINPANGGIQEITLGASRTPAATNFTAGQSVLLKIADGAAYAITWTTVAVTWIGGVAPPLATTGWTWVELWKVGSTICGAHVGDSA